MKTYTVVGVYSDNKQVYVTHVEAKSVPSAISKTRKEMADGYVLCVFEGDHADLYGADEMMTD